MAAKFAGAEITLGSARGAHTGAETSPTGANHLQWSPHQVAACCDPPPQACPGWVLPDFALPWHNPESRTESPGSGGIVDLSDLHREAAHDGCFDVVQRFRVWKPPQPPAAAVSG